MKNVILEFDRGEVDMLMRCLLIIASDALRHKELEHLKDVGYMLQNIGSQIKNQ